MPEGNNNICFFIAPIGEIGSEIRKRSDQVLNHIIKPAAKEFNYEAIRADQISEPGIITTQIVQHIMDDAIVVADLTGRNPNVFYELAIRHAIRKPYVQVIQRGEEKPFDVAGVRTVEIDHHDLDSVQSAKDEIIRQITSMNKEGYMVDSPISITIDFERLKKSENPEQRQLADVLSAMADLRSGLASIEKKLEETLSSKQIGSLSKMRNTENKVNDILFYLLHSPQETLSSLEDMQNVLLELELSLKGSTSKRDFEMVYEKFKKLQILVTDLMKKQKMDVYRGEEMLHSLKSIL
jgi:hypothetical protein